MFKCIEFFCKACVGVIFFLVKLHIIYADHAGNKILSIFKGLCPRITQEEIA